MSRSAIGREVVRMMSWHDRDVDLQTFLAYVNSGAVIVGGAPAKLIRMLEPDAT